ncbi:MAG: phosphotransferase [Planctomycetota bacterium]|nr:phosphotransferase [Planctomycetota bacterium]
MKGEDLPTRVLERFGLQGPGHSLGTAGGFSGARFWQIQQAQEDWGIRRWPREHPPVSRLRWIHSVLRHSLGHGFSLLPAMRTTPAGESFVREAGFLWECSRWMPGIPALEQDPSPVRIANALDALARFHRSVEDFLPRQDRSPAPAIESRLAFYQSLVDGRFNAIQGRLGQSDWTDLNQRAGKIVDRFQGLRGQLQPRLASAACCRVTLVPCIRDMRPAHVLFVGDQVSSFIDFGAIRIDSVAADVARLLGSITSVGDEQWTRGLEAYQAVRSLDQEEQELVVTLELANRAMAGMQWLRWILVEGRQFEDRQAVIRRLDEL